MNFIKRLVEIISEWWRPVPLYEPWMFDEKNWGPPIPVEDLGDPLIEEFKDLYK